MNPQFNNPLTLIQQFRQFKQNFKGDPKQQVQDLLNSGKMTQDQLEYLENTAMDLQKIFR